MFSRCFKKLARVLSVAVWLLAAGCGVKTVPIPYVIANPEPKSVQTEGGKEKNTAIVPTKPASATEKGEK